jgi:hypothetical protein
MSPVQIVEAWQRAANEANAEQLLELSDSNIEIVGPRGIATGHEILREWLRRAGITLRTRQLYVRENTVVADQQGVWRSTETGEIVGKANVATHFQVSSGRVAYLARYDNLDEALQKAGLTLNDVVEVGG